MAIYKKYVYIWYIYWYIYKYAVWLLYEGHIDIVPMPDHALSKLTSLGRLYSIEL